MSHKTPWPLCAPLARSAAFCLGLVACRTPAEAPDLSLPDDAASPPDGLIGDLRPPGDLADAAPRDGGGRQIVRIAASNLTSGTEQSYDPGHGVRILRGLRPDIALVQEFNYRTNSDTDLRAFVDAAFDPSYTYYREPTGANIPNGVVSRYPIRDAGVWDDPQTGDRDMVWARIDVPGPRDLWAVSVHLLTASASTRDRQARTLVGFVRAQVPADDYLVIGGDFNTDSRTEAALSTLGQIVVTDPALAPAPVDGAGNPNTNAGRERPYDWVLADPDLNPLRAPVAIGAARFPAGLVFDSRVYQPLADVAPVQAGDSGAKNMQHMAVVKDFALPE